MLREPRTTSTVIVLGCRGHTAPDRHDPFIGLWDAGGCDVARFKHDADLQRLGRLRFSTCPDGLLAPAPCGCRQASPSGAVRPKTRPHSRVEAVHAGCLSKTLRHFLQHCRKYTLAPLWTAALRVAPGCPLSHPGPPPLPDQAQDRPIGDPWPEPLAPPVMIQAIEACTHVCVNNPAHGLLPAPLAPHLPGLMRAAALPEAVRAVVNVWRLDLAASPRPAAPPCPRPPAAPSVADGRPPSAPRRA